MFILYYLDVTWPGLAWPGLSTGVQEYVDAGLDKLQVVMKKERAPVSAGGLIRVHTMLARVQLWL